MDRWLHWVPLSLALSFFLGLSSAGQAAESSSSGEATEQPTFRSEVGAEFSYTAPSRLRLEGFGLGFGDLDTLHYRVSYGLGIRTSPDWEWRTGLEFNQFSFGVPDRAPLPNTLYGLAVPLGFNWQINHRWQLRVSVRPGVYSDYEDISLDDVFAPALLGVNYRVNPDLNLLSGFSIDARRDIPVFPYLGARWHFAEQWTLSALFPRPAIEYQLTEPLTVFAGASLRGMAAQVSEHFGSDRGLPGLDDTSLTYWEIRTGAGVRYRLARVLVAELDGGWTIERRFVFREPDVTLKTSGAPYVQCSLTASF